MKRGRQNANRYWPGLILIGLLVMCSPRLSALNPELNVDQYAHTAWRVREGFTQGYIKSIAQTPDGYIWLGTGFGLFRFDGVRIEHWQPPLNGEQLPSDFIVSLYVARDGTFWIGTRGGLASWRDGKLTRYPNLAGLLVGSIFEDRNGTVWVGSSSLVSPGKLCAIDRTNGDCHGSGAALPKSAGFLYQDSHDVLWMVAPDGVWRWKPGPARFYHMPFGTAVSPNLSEAADGTLLIPLPGVLAQFAGGKREEQYPYPAPARNVAGTKILRDHDGGIWIGTAGAGVVHLHHGRADVFSQADGLSGDLVTSLFEDREGNVWVATLGGLDRFRNYAVTTYAQHEGVATIPGRGSVVTGKDGSIWMGTSDGLRVWNHGEVTIYGKADDHDPQSKTVWSPVRYMASRGLGDHLAVSVFAPNAGRILVSTPYEFGYMDNGRFVPIRGIPGGAVTSVAQDRQGDLWIANEGQGLLRLSKDGTVQQISWASIGHRDGAQSLAADRLTGGLWIGFDEGGVAYFSDGQIKETYGRAERLGNGRVSALHIDTNDAVWAATEGGLSRIKNGHVLTLTSKNGLPFDAIHWSTQDENQSFWLNTTCGLARIARSELDAWVADPRRKIESTLFDSSDGMSNAPIGLHAGSQVIWTSDRKMWFQGFLGGASEIDPHHLPSNKIPPTVEIERISANGKTYDASNGLRLPPQIRDLKIDYAALSFVAPEKLRFRYQLEGQDRSWVEVTNDRDVQYSNLRPGNYVFRVTAANDSGLWSEAGASLHFSIAPAYYQTTLFRALCAAAFVALLWALYQLRLHQVRRQFASGLEARVSERLRIAGELHDTLLQSFLALMFRFQAARNMVPRRPEDAMNALDEAIDATSKAIAEGREAITDLRPDPVAERDLPELLNATSRELAAAKGVNGHSPVFRVTVEGKPRTISIPLQDEVYRIARETIRNAYRHADANLIEAEIHYDKDRLRLRIRDDGRGVDPTILATGGRPGHWGIPGMLERAKRIGAQLKFWTEEGAGTEVELVLPAAIAYQRDRNRSRFELFRKATNDEQRSQRDSDSRRG
jgi:signal transduction histidine kinase/ligand-binding sensor domain-containing protein